MKNLFKIKYLATVINALIAVVMFGLILLGVLYTIHGFVEMGHIDRLHERDFHPGLILIEALDVFLIALVFLVFVVGINVLFIQHSNKEYLDNIPKWMRIKNYTDLKLLLMEAIITTLFVIFISAMVRQGDKLSWNFLAFPGSILLLSISLKLIKSRPTKKSSEK